MSKGKVYLVGAGPGDPGLLTIRGLECIKEADVIVYDRLVHPSTLSHGRSDAELIYVGKTSGAHTMNQEDINRLLSSKALEGKIVVRLKGGDPFVFGRGGEEAEHLANLGIEFEVVPGVTSAIAVPAYAGIPVTHREFVSSFAVVTGHGKAQKDGQEEDQMPLASSISQLACFPGTLVFLMGMENLREIVAELVKGGLPPSTPVAIIRWGTLPSQETLIGTLECICAEVERANFKPPAVIVVGEVVRLREKLRWFDNRPLFGKNVLVTRSRDQASALSDLLRKCGANPIEFPLIKIVSPTDFSRLDMALDHIEEYDWLIFTSTNGFKAVVSRLEVLGRDIRWLKGPKICAIGSATAEAIRAFGIRVDFVPSQFIAEAIVHEFPEEVSGKRILLPRAEEARETLPEKLGEQGAVVDVVSVYRTELDETGEISRIREMLSKGEIDIITFTSSSTVKNFVKLIGTCVPEKTTIACIGPITAHTAKELGIEPDVVAERYTIEGLVNSLIGSL
ncbi:MAG: uroporphyrinogen-III C-methyltransferase [Armatimonadetes bacterium]|nr:uroporphyrinogen-III C-methyltransferase [Armatimonadota bacterium]